MAYKVILGGVAVALGLISNIPYYAAVLRKRVHPHIFTWLIWGITNAITFFAQFSSNAQAGAWATGTGTFSCFGIVLLGLRYGEKNITRGDWITLAIILAAIPLWMICKTPLYSVLLITGMDMLGYYPTLRKSWNDPYGESVFAYSLGVVGLALSVLAITDYSLVNWIYPTCVTAGSTVLIGTLLIRRTVKSAVKEL